MCGGRGGRGGFVFGEYGICVTEGTQLFGRVVVLQDCFGGTGDFN